MGNKLTSQEICTILAGMSDQDRAIFSVYAYSMARARTLQVSDLRSNGRRFWLQIHKKNGRDDWQEIHSWLWSDIVRTRAGRSTSPNAPVFSSPRHPDQFYSIQELNRKLRRYAQLAGVSTDLRVQDLRGVMMDSQELENTRTPMAQPIPSNPFRKDYRLHGIGRRSFARPFRN